MRIEVTNTSTAPIHLDLPGGVRLNARPGTLVFDLDAPTAAALRAHLAGPAASWVRAGTLAVSGLPQAPASKAASAEALSSSGEGKSGKR